MGTTVVDDGNTGAKGAAASGNVTLGAPASPAVGDAWIAVVHSADQAAHTFTDWTQLFQANGGGTTSRLSVWIHRYNGVTPNLTVGHTAGGTIVGGIKAFLGVKPGTAPTHVVGTGGTGTDASIEHTSISITLPNCLLLAINGSADDNARTALGGRFITVFDEAGTLNYSSTLGTPDCSIAMEYDTNAAIGSTGTVTQTQAASDAWASVLIAFEPVLTFEPMHRDLVLSTTAPIVAIGEKPRAIVLDAIIRAVQSTGVTISPARVDLLLSSVAPSLVVDTVRAPAQGNLALSTVAPTVLVSITAAPAQANLTLSSVAPTVLLATLITPAQGNLALSSVAPERALGTIIAPSQGNIALSTVAPTVTVDVRPAPARVDLTLSSVAPDIALTEHRDISPARGDLSLSTFAPTVELSAQANITPEHANLTISTTAPSLMMHGYLHPDADVSDGGWTDQDGGTDLFAAIDENDFNDADYIKSSSDPATDLCEVSLSDPVTVLTEPFKVIYRMGKAGTSQIDLTVRLMEGATEIAEWAHTDISETLQTVTQTLTGGQFATIVNMNNLSVEFEANKP